MELIEENNESVHKQYFPVYALFLLLISIGIYECKSKGSYVEYSIKKEFSGIIESMYFERSQVYLKLNSGDNKIEIESCQNYTYDVPELREFISIGDSIYKNQCSDTVFVKRKGQEYNFIQWATWYNNESKTAEFVLKYKAERLLRLAQNNCPVDSLALDVAIELIKKQN